MLHCLRLTTLALLLTLMGGLANPAQAQEQDPRFGIGFQGLTSTEEGSVIGFGLRGRLSFPINADLSLGAGTGLTGFILEGRDEASYVFDPQASFIISLPDSPERVSYILAGAGAYLSFSNDGGVNGPTIHGGYGRAHLLNQTTFFWEVNPAVIIGSERVGLALPVRLGVIF